ncbi:MAG: hypothetical protein JSV91_04735 [Phycisphaerales bacterium]|nr:MAG: hypothetical protein JSV91_04735 [Phycisphaerales bacterium]
MAGTTITFPMVLARLDYANRLTEADYRGVTVDPRETICRYVEFAGTKGIKYERYVNSDENLAYPHRLTRNNFRNSKKVNSQGWHYSWVEDLIDRDWPELARVPLDADALETDAFDADAIAVLVALCQYRGIRVANATKLLYQKRPRLIPILDVLARKALGVHWAGGDDAFRDAFALGFRRVREVAAHRNNARVLSDVTAWLESDPGLTGGLPLSRLRILDILAWQVGR